MTRRQKQLKQKQLLLSPSLEDCKKIAYRYISRYSCSSRRLREYLDRKGCSKYSALIVSDFLDLGFLNDWEYAAQLIKAYAGKYSSKMIMAKLCKKGVPRDIAEEAVATLGSEDEKKAALRTLRAALKNQMRKTSDFDELSTKLKAALFRKGFSSSVVDYAIETMKKEMEMLSN